MHIAIFGGSFDPPHLGHLLVANTLVDQKHADAVWFMPCADHPFHKNLTPVEHRVAMLQKLGHQHSICMYEAHKLNTSYSIETLEYFQALFPYDSFSWVMGSDQLATFNKWHRYQELTDNFHIFVYPREGYPAHPLHPNMTLLKDVSLSSASSTHTRQLLAAGQSITELTPPDIISYIQLHQLYQS